MIARGKIRNADSFAALNVTLFLLMAWFVYHDRLIAYRGYGNVHEFFIYACVILAVILACWWCLRRIDYPRWLLALLQIGILAHFAGAFVPIEGGRLYDAYLLGIRYDKYVHAFKAFAGAALIAYLLDLWGARAPLKGLRVTALVLAAGTMVEIVEYLVMLTVPNAGVGGYDNNMQDLISNLFGGALWSMVAMPIAALYALFAAGLWLLGPQVAAGSRAALASFWLLLATGAVWLLYVSPVRLHREPPALRGWPRAGDSGAFREAWRAYALWTLLAAAAMLAIGWLADPGMWAHARLDAIGIKLVGYLVFGLIQALIFFGFVETRLRAIVPERLGPARHRLLVAAATALIFAAAHFPNPALMAITLGGGFAWALIFYHRPNTLLLALSHAILGTILHRIIQLHMRIGPFYTDTDSYILRTAIPGLSEMIGPRF